MHRYQGPGRQGNRLLRRLPCLNARVHHFSPFDIAFQLTSASTGQMPKLVKRQNFDDTHVASARNLAILCRCPGVQSPADESIHMHDRVMTKHCATDRWCRRENIRGAWWHCRVVLACLVRPTGQHTLLPRRVQCVLHGHRRIACVCGRDHHNVLCSHDECRTAEHHRRWRYLSICELMDTAVPAVLGGAQRCSFQSQTVCPHLVRMAAH
jgi:hypothetical protein